MPKDSSTASKSGSRLPKGLIVLIAGSAKRVVRCPTSHANAVILVKRLFPSLRHRDISFTTKELPFFEGEDVGIEADAWDSITPGLTSLAVVIGSSDVDEALPAALQLTPSENDAGTNVSPSKGPTTRIYVDSSLRPVRRLEYTMISNVPVECLMQWVREDLGTEQNENMFYFQGRRVCSADTVQSLGLRDGAVLEHRLDSKNGTPVMSSVLTVNKASRADVAVVPDVFPARLPVSRPLDDGPSDSRDDTTFTRRTRITISVESCSRPGNPFHYTICSTTPMTRLMSSLSGQLGIPQDDVRLCFSGDRVSPGSTTASLGMVDGDVLEHILPQKGGKPVIYLFPPAGETLSANVSLSLVREWSFSAVYPPAPVTQNLASTHLGDAIEWGVIVQPGGEMRDIGSGVDVSYLYWEAETNHQSPTASMSHPNPSDTAEEDDNEFSPLTSNLSPDNSVLLRIDDVPAYLDRALKALDLHVEARTSFITYWLPSLLKHTFVALRFVPQAAYERASVLKVTPEPDVVERIFMLFKGVEPTAVGSWKTAEARATEDVRMWRQVVGLSGEAGNLMSNESLFRVLEWGGMEVLH